MELFLVIVNGFHLILSSTFIWLDVLFFIVYKWFHSLISVDALIFMTAAHS